MMPHQAKQLSMHLASNLLTKKENWLIETKCPCPVVL